MVGLISGVTGLFFLFFPQFRPEVGKPAADESATITGVVVNPHTTRGQYLAYSDQSRLGFTKQQLSVVGASAFARVTSRRLPQPQIDPRPAADRRANRQRDRRSARLHGHAACRPGDAPLVGLGAAAERPRQLHHGDQALRRSAEDRDHLRPDADVRRARRPTRRQPAANLRGVDPTLSWSLARAGELDDQQEPDPDPDRSTELSRVVEAERVESSPRAQVRPAGDCCAVDQR